MRKWIVVPLTVVLLMSVVPAFAQKIWIIANKPSDEYITVKKSDLPPEVLERIEVVDREESEESQWFFLLTGPPTTRVFTVVGPFKDEADCAEIHVWVKEHKGSTVSRCWYSGD